MQFSLRSRFRGAFLGAALGQVFAAIALSQTEQTQAPQAQSHLPLCDSLHPAQVWRSISATNFVPVGGEIDWGKQAVQQTRDLIELKPLQRHDSHSQPFSAIEFLPLMLFCHENLEQFQQALIPLLAEGSTGQQTEILAIALTISLMLREQFLPDRLIPLLLEGKQLPQVEQSGLGNQLRQVESWLIELTPLSMLPSVSLSPLASALYSVLKTPASFPLALMHTLRLTPDPEAAALVGLLAGTHLSEAGLPIGWRQALDRAPMPAALQGRHQSLLLQTLWGISSTAELLDWADRLWAAWSGAFQPQQWQLGRSTVTAIPRLVRPR